MLRLHQFGPSFGLLNASPFCMKTELLLRHLGLEYKTVVHRSPSSSPTGKLPMLEDDGERIPDSSRIHEHLVRTRGVDPDAHLDAADRGRGRALQRLLEDHLYWVLVYSRWVDDRGWATMRKVLSGVPAPVRWVLEPMLRRRVRGQLHAQGLGRHPPEVVYAFAEEDLDALAGILEGGGPFLLGDTLSSVDLVGFATLANVLWSPIDTPLRDAGRARPPLDAYCRRCHAALLPGEDMPRYAP